MQNKTPCCHGFQVLRGIHQGALYVLCLLEHREASHETLPTFLCGSCRFHRHAMVCEPLLGNGRAAFQRCHSQIGFLIRWFFLLVDLLCLYASFLCHSLSRYGDSGAPRKKDLSGATPDLLLLHYLQSTKVE